MSVLEAGARMRNDPPLSDPLSGCSDCPGQPEPAIVKPVCHAARRLFALTLDRLSSKRVRHGSDGLAPKPRKPLGHGTFRGGRYWARTSDLRLVEAALSQLS